MPSIHNLEKIISALPVLLELAKRNNYVLPIKTIQKILNVRNQKEVISIINHLCMITSNVLGSPLDFFNVYYEDEFVYFDSKTFPSIHKINLPLDERDLENLKIALSEEKELWKYLIKKIDLDIFLEIDQYKQDTILKLFTKAIGENEQVWFYYKKLNSSTVELKKIIPLKIHKNYENYYIFGYDLQGKNDLTYKFYRIDRIIEVVKVVKNQRKLNLSVEKIESLTQMLNYVDKPEEEIIFVYDPSVEINLKNYITFHKVQHTLELENRTWWMGKIKTKFPNYFLEIAIYFAKWIYVIKPKTFNEKIKDHYKKILERLYDHAL